MLNLILKTINDKRMTIFEVTEQTTTENGLSLYKYITGSNPDYPITLKETVEIANALETDIFTLFPGLPKRQPKQMAPHDEIETSEGGYNFG